MTNPDGVALGNSRVTSENRDGNRDWYETNLKTVEVNVVRANILAVDQPMVLTSSLTGTTRWMTLRGATLSIRPLGTRSSHTLSVDGL